MCAAAVFAVAATAAFGADDQEANLDPHPEMEQVRVVDERPGDDPPSFAGSRRYRVHIVDTCRDGSTVDAPVGELGAGVTGPTIVAADTRKGDEVLFKLRDTGNAPDIEARLVAWRRAASSPCRAAHTLFLYEGAEGKRTRPPGTMSLVSYFVSVEDYADRYAGREVRLDEWFADEDDGLCCPSVRRRSFHRYDAAGDRYVQYRVRVKRDQEL